MTDRERIKNILLSNSAVRYTLEGRVLDEDDIDEITNQIESYINLVRKKLV